MIYSSSTSHTKPFTLVLGVAFALIVMTVVIAAIAGGKFDLRSRAGYVDDCKEISKNLNCPAGYPDVKNPKQDPNKKACCKAKPTRIPPTKKPTVRPTGNNQVSPTRAPTKVPTINPTSCNGKGGKCAPESYKNYCTRKIDGTCASGMVCVDFSSCSMTPPAVPTVSTGYCRIVVFSGDCEAKANCSQHTTRNACDTALTNNVPCCRWVAN